MERSWQYIITGQYMCLAVRHLLYVGDLNIKKSYTLPIQVDTLPIQFITLSIQFNTLSILLYTQPIQFYSPPNAVLQFGFTHCPMR